LLFIRYFTYTIISATHFISLYIKSPFYQEIY
jgi:hypothetical protein